MDIFNSADDVEECVVAFNLFTLLLNIIITVKNYESKRSPRRWWVRPIYRTRDIHGFYIQTFKIIKERDIDQFFKVTRMHPQDFDLLLNLLKEKLNKESNRKAIDEESRLALTLLYLSQGAPIQVIAWCFKVGVSTARKIIFETSDAIWDTLSPLYVSIPSKHDWEKYEKSFFDKCNFPNCVGAIDGKHVNIQCHPHAGSQYYNYKQHHSIVLMAACDADLIFTYVDIGAYGSQSDGGIFQTSAFGRSIINGELPHLGPKALPLSDILFPRFFVADAAFPLRTNIMRPFPNRGLTMEQTYFNTRLSRARRTIENAFGVLAARWRILTTTINALPDNVTKIVKATVVLHNFCKLTSSNYCTANYVHDTETSQGSWREETEGLASVQASNAHNSSRQAYELRDILKEYIWENKT